MTRSLVLRVLFTSCVFVALASCGTGGAVIDRLTVENQTTYDLEVRVTGGQRDGWISLGRVYRGQRVVTEDVEDLGATWIFRFDYAGHVFGGESRLARDQLVADDWTISVPRTVERQLRTKGIEPSVVLH